MSGEAKKGWRAVNFHASVGRVEKSSEGLGHVGGVVREGGVGCAVAGERMATRLASSRQLNRCKGDRCMKGVFCKLPKNKGIPVL